MNPTYLAVVGPFGRAVGARLQDDGLDAATRLAAFPLPGEVTDRPWREVVDGFRGRVADELRELLRSVATVGDSGADGDVRGLDLVLVADVAEAGGELVTLVANLLSSVLRSELAVMFPPDLPAEQRGVHLVVVLATPPIDAAPAGREAVRAVAALERWHRQGPPSPCLDRIYVLPRQNELMPLSPEDVERATYLFVSTAYARGLRHTEAMRKRLGAPRDPERLVATFAVAAADVEVARVVDTFAWRSALAGLETLAAQCEAPHGGDRHVAPAGDLDVDTWCGPLAQRGVAPGRLDLIEAEALRTARKEIRQLVDTRLAGDEGLRNVSLLSSSLGLARQRVEAAARAAAAWLAEESPATVDRRPEPDDRRPATETDPDPGISPSRTPPSLLQILALALLLVGLGGAAAAGISTVLAVPPTAPGPSAGVRVTHGKLKAETGSALYWGAAGGGLLGALWVTLSLLSRRRRTQADDEAERDATEAKRETPTTRRAGQLAETDLALRRRRVARGALRQLDEEQRRLRAIRTSVIDAQARARDALKRLGLQQRGGGGGDDDYTYVLEADTPLHRALVPATALPRLWQQSRSVRDDELWAHELLRAAWPRDDARDDLPFGPGEAWEEALRRQHQVLRDSGVFSWPDVGDVLPEQIRRFLGGAPRGLGFGVKPRRSDGTPDPLVDAHEYLVVVPPAGQALAERGLREQPVPGHLLLAGGQQLSRLVVLRTGGDLDAASLERSL